MATKLRIESVLAPAESYAKPRQEMLPAEIVESKRQLDIDTHFDLGGVSQACRDAPDAIEGPDGQRIVPPRSPLPLVHEISYRWVERTHLWIGVGEGIVIVLDDDEHALFLKLRDGAAPADLAALLKGGWPPVERLVGRLAAAGFIRGVEGHTDRWEPSPGRFMRLHLTKLCNLSCAHCYADSSPWASTKGQMDAARWLKVIDDFADAGGERVLFTGGEALTYPGCDTLLRRSHERDLDVTLFSNGLLIDRHLDVIKLYVDQVQISIDGPDAETNDPIRGAGTFARAKRAVDTLLDNGVKVRISMVVMEANIAAVRADFLPFARQWADRGVEWRLGYGVARHGRGDEMDDTLEIHDVRPVVDALMRELEGEVGPLIARSTSGCGYAEQIVVAPDGAIHPCHLLDGAITHVEDQPMGELIKLLHRTSDDYDVNNTIGCNRCDIRHLCGGGCRIQNGKFTGNRRVSNCTAFDKLHRLGNLVKTFTPEPVG
ncbi:MAG TPA: radical SAM protein [Allosphingosinicella sp.]|jgi:radical SAM protein with 4Fe4S-binding SPASM domain|nr:radical SAM protein [Allosphingosinicella sp.]